MAIIEETRKNRTLVSSYSLVAKRTRDPRELEGQVSGSTCTDLEVTRKESECRFCVRKAVRISLQAPWFLLAIVSRLLDGLHSQTSNALLRRDHVESRSSLGHRVDDKAIANEGPISWDAVYETKLAVPHDFVNWVFFDRQS
jgi:hypothetical protein